MAHFKQSIIAVLIVLSLITLPCDAIANDSEVNKVKMIQFLLKELGYYSGSYNGKNDVQTQSAIDKISNSLGIDLSKENLDVKEVILTLVWRDKINKKAIPFATIPNFEERSRIINNEDIKKDKVATKVVTKTKEREILVQLWGSDPDEDSSGYFKPTKMIATWVIKSKPGVVDEDPYLLCVAATAEMNQEKAREFHKKDMQRAIKTLLDYGYSSSEQTIQFYQSALKRIHNYQYLIDCTFPNEWSDLSYIISPE